MDETTALRTMAERLAAWVPGVAPSPGPHEQQPRIMPLTVPREWPATIPLPPDVVIIGAVYYSGSPPSTELMLDVPQDERHVRAFYRDALGRAGWKLLEQTLRHGGFLYHGPVMHYERDTEDVEGGMNLVVDVKPAGTGITQVRLTATVFTTYSQVRPPRQSLPPGLSLLPAVTLPPDAEVLPGGGNNWSGNRAESAMVICTDMDQAGLAAFVAGQLERAGWARAGGGEAGALTWSSWDFTDDAGQPYRGTLSVLRHPERAGLQRLILEAEWVKQR